jgi:hypothetical protein
MSVRDVSPHATPSDGQPLWNTACVPAGPGPVISRHSQDVKKGCGRHPRTRGLYIPKTNWDDMAGKGGSASTVCLRRNWRIETDH